MTFLFLLVALQQSPVRTLSLVSCSKSVRNRLAGGDLRLANLLMTVTCHISRPLKTSQADLVALEARNTSIKNPFLFDRQL